MMDKDKYIELAGKVADGTASDQEIALYNSYYNAYQHKYPSWTQLDEQQRKEMLAETQEEIHNQLHEHAEDRQTKLWPRIIGVAAAVAAITLGVWLYYASNLNGRHLEGSAATRDLLNYANDIAPGKNTATIKIGDGAAITLSDKQTGVIVGDELRYTDNSVVSNSTNKRSLPYGRDDGRMLTVTTPRGGTYQVTLPDGTKVWLNAASVLTYTMPLKERGGIRKVELSGEAYFEVFRNKLQPFVVTAKNLTTTVLGTHFNISAYKDERSTKATLLEGSVRVSIGGSINGRHPEGSEATRDLLNSTNKRSLPAVRDDGGANRDDGQGAEGGMVLKPNQQALVTGSSAIAVKQIDPEEAVAWKEGYFKFNNEPLTGIMLKISRWYNVEVVYQDESVKTAGFGGTVSRFSNVSQILNKLQLTGKAHFKIEGQRIIVTK
ncbi:FecR family protein [Pedobacter heparinus]|uniref:FecR family protein n=1 Tax=Pedobacter heparinus TaxID=984 RepID=UPI00293021E0|nr:FecR domain-containing protein [Pedobacter heparinus]